MRTKVVVTAIVLCIAVCVIAIPALSQPGAVPDKAALKAAMGGGPGGGGGIGLLATPAMVVADGILYVAFDGKVTAFDAKTLAKIAEAIYWERPVPVARPEGIKGDKGGGAKGGGGAPPTTPAPAP